MTGYKRYGLIGGLAMGLLGGVMVGGPHLREWPLLQSIAVVLGGGAIGAFIGFIALNLIMGTLTSDSGAGIGDGGIGGGSVVGGHVDGGSNGGDGGGAGDG